MTLKNCKVSIGGKPLWNLEAVSLNPVGRCFDMKVDGNTFSCSVKYNEQEWARLSKLLARTIKIGLDKPMPTVKKGQKITVHYQNGFEDRDLTGILFHIRKPRKDSEARIYYIREEFAGIPKAA